MLFKFLNQSISMAWTAFKRPSTKKLGMHGLFILGLGIELVSGLGESLSV